MALCPLVPSIGGVVQQGRFRTAAAHETARCYQHAAGGCPAAAGTASRGRVALGGTASGGDSLQTDASAAGCSCRSRPGRARCLKAWPKVPLLEKTGDVSKGRYSYGDLVRNSDHGERKPSALHPVEHAAKRAGLLAATSQRGGAIMTSAQPVHLAPRSHAPSTIARYAIAL
jgi:hypothetical protein